MRNIRLTMETYKRLALLKLEMNFRTFDEAVKYLLDRIERRKA